MLSALGQGIRNAASAPGLLLLLWLAGLLVALPAAVIVEEAIHDSVKWSEANESLRAGFDTGWFGEFDAEVKGLAATLAPDQVGLGATLGALDAWWSGRLFKLPVPIVALGSVFVLLWILLMGAILSRLHRPWDRWSLSDMLSAGAEFFPRFFRLSILSAGAYYAVYRLSRWLFPRIEFWTRDVTSETRILLLNLAGAVVIVGLLAAIRAVIDYSRISMVVGGQRSAVLALAQGFIFVLGRPVATGGLVLVFGALTALALAVYSAVAPGASESSPVAIVLALAASQLFLVVRLGLRVGLLGSQMALFEHHGGRG